MSSGVGHPSLSTGVLHMCSVFSLLYLLSRSASTKLAGENQNVDDEAGVDFDVDRVFSASFVAGVETDPSTSTPR